MNNINIFFIEIIPFLGGNLNKIILSSFLIVQNVPNKNQFGSVYFRKITKELMKEEDLLQQFSL